MAEHLEQPEEFYARVAAAAGEEARLPVAVTEMAGWDIFPFEIASLRIKPLQSLAEAEPPRRGEDPLKCWCASPGDDPEQTVWSNEHWILAQDMSMRLPIAVNLMPREHCDLTTVPGHLRVELGQLIVSISAAIEALPSVGRAQLARYGDGGAHLHLFFFGRPARMLQLRGSPLLDWEENLPAVPGDVLRANAAYVAGRLIERVGGTGPVWS